MVRRWMLCGLLAIGAGLLAGCRVPPANGPAGTLAPQKAISWKFAVLCDSRGDKKGGSENGVRTAILGPLAQAIAEERPDLVIFPGDEVCGDPSAGDPPYGDLKSQLETWKATMSPILDQQIPIYMARGNHEAFENQPEPRVPGNELDVANYAAWQEVFPYLPRNGPSSQADATYYVDHNNAKFVLFDQYLGRKPSFDDTLYDSAKNGGTVDQWVVDQIRNASQDWVFVGAHEPLFIMHHKDCMANDPVGRDQVLDALGSRHGGGVFFAGHDHGYWRTTVKDADGHRVPELIVGCAGAPFYLGDNVGLNAVLGRGEVPAQWFVNGRVPDVGPNPNTGDLPAMWGYLICTVEGRRLTGEWHALTNGDPQTFTVEGTPHFEIFDTFVLNSAG